MSGAYAEPRLSAPPRGMASEAPAAATASRVVPIDGTTPTPVDGAGFAFRGLSLGAAIGWQVRDDVGPFDRTVLTPELILQGYLATPVDDVFLRVGLRVGYGIEQAESPTSLRFLEHDIGAHFALTLLYDWWVVPTLTVGTGPLIRVLEVSTDVPIDAENDLSDVSVLFSGYLQIGVGLPIAKGILIIEPFARYEWVPADARILNRFGTDVTVTW